MDSAQPIYHRSSDVVIKDSLSFRATIKGPIRISTKERLIGKRDGSLDIVNTAAAAAVADTELFEHAILVAHVVAGLLTRASGRTGVFLGGRRDVAPYKQLKYGKDFKDDVWTFTLGGKKSMSAPKDSIEVRLDDEVVHVWVEIKIEAIDGETSYVFEEASTQKITEEVTKRF